MEDGRRNAVHKQFLRPLRKSDWVKNVKGVRVSAWIDGDHNVLCVSYNEDETWYEPPERIFIEKALADNGVPIAPAGYVMPEE
jgi:hypothetical protein